MNVGEFRIGDLTKQVRGLSYKKELALSEPESGYLPVLRANNINENFQIIYEDLIYLPEEIVKEDQFLQEGDILIAASSGSIKVVGRGARFSGKLRCSFGAFCKVIRPVSQQVLSGYIAHYFQSQRYRREIANLAIGANILNIKNRDIDNLILIAPEDLTTQREIVTALDKAKALVDMRQQSFELLNEFLRATFRELFGDPVENPKGWRKEDLGNLLDDIESGWSPKCENYSRDNDEQWAVLKLSSVTYKRFTPDENKVLPVETAIKKELIPTEGDVLFTRKNTLELVGAAAYVFDSTKNLLLPDTIFRLVYKTDDLSGIYLWYLLNDSKFKQVVRPLATGATQSMSNISKERLRSLSIPVPELDLQKQFENFVLKSEILRSKLEEMLNGNQTLFQSLLQRAFHGDLTIDPNLQLDGYLEKENFKAIAADTVLIQTLIDRFNQAKTDALSDEGGTLEEQDGEEESQSFRFENEATYNLAKNALFQLLKEGLVTQKTPEKEEEPFKTYIATI